MSDGVRVEAADLTDPAHAESVRTLGGADETALFLNEAL